MCDLYGFLSNELTYISRELEEALSISLELHESSFRGGDYYYYRSGKPWEVELILQRNMELEDEIAEPDYSDQEIILYVCTRNQSSLRRIRELILKKMEGQVALLRSQS